MSAKLTEFITEWLRKNVVGQIASADDIPYLIVRCVGEASERGITRLELEAEVGPLDECIRGALKRRPDKRHRSPKPKGPRRR